MAKTAELHRMVMDEHVCPYGLKSKHILKKQGFEVDDHPLTSREETDAFMEEHGVETTPQTFIGGERIGGYDDLLVFFGKEDADGNETSYRPVIAIFAVAAAIAVALAIGTFGTIWNVRTIEWFIALSMCFLAEIGRAHV